MILIVPCYNEEQRLDQNKWIELSSKFETILFVNDGSTDGTQKVLKHLESQSSSIECLKVEVNIGKAEAIRHGVLHLLKTQNGQETLVGYCDADLSTPLEEILRLEQVITEKNVGFLLGARVKLAGWKITRSGSRHYLGRLSATLIGLTLKMQVYDTQAGAKIFKSRHLKSLFQEPFISKWLFDCELILRAKKHDISISEEPLREWTHQAADSKINPSSYLNSLADLFKIHRKYFK